MPLNTQVPLDRLITVLQALAGMQQVYRGVPESIGSRVSAYVALAGQRLVDKTGGLVQREARYFVGFAYRVGGAEANAENTLAALVDAFITAMLAERRSNLGGTVDSVSLDLSLSDAPEYQPVAGQEFRVFPVLVLTTQQHTF